ncbi:MAG: hypothetical protein KDA61_09145, partial [Planctomycetales bacterium]|nr:hypothetical protein [Planctomycetales bacterium]
MNRQGWWLTPSLLLLAVAAGCRQPAARSVSLHADAAALTMPALPSPATDSPQTAGSPDLAAPYRTEQQTERRGLSADDRPDDFSSQGTAPSTYETVPVSWQSSDDSLGDVQRTGVNDSAVLNSDEAVPAPLPPIDLDQVDTRPFEPSRPTASASSNAEVIAVPPLALEDVLASVVNHYPLLQVAIAERQIAYGKELSTLGEFDTAAKGYSLAQPLGFYQNYRSLVGVTQPLTTNGGEVFAGYKIGDGFFQPWYKERETDEGGELSAGFQLSLWQNRGIDKRRAAYFKARLDRLATNPYVQTQWLDFSRSAAQAYWSWVAAGRTYEAQRQLLDLALTRVDQIAERIRVGDLERIADIDNRRLIASRETKL